jgi:hypothetical protein
MPLEHRELGPRQQKPMLNKITLLPFFIFRQLLEQVILPFGPLCSDAFLKNTDRAAMLLVGSFRM